MANYEKLIEFVNKSIVIGSAEHAKYTNLMCWHAAVACAEEVGYNTGIRTPLVEIDCKYAITMTNSRVVGYDDLLTIPEPGLIGFFTGIENPETIKHMMVFLGKLEAVGTKNNCLDIGNGTWEKLDLNQLKWDRDTNKKNIIRGKEGIYIRYTPLR